MVILNFAHPLTDEHLGQLEALTGAKPQRTIEVSCQFDLERPLGPQVAALVDSCGLSAREWQTTPVLVNPPAFHSAAAILAAELEGRMGHLPTIVRMRPVASSVPRRFAVAELCDLQSVREEARRHTARSQRADAGPPGGDVVAGQA